MIDVLNVLCVLNVLYVIDVLCVTRYQGRMVHGYAGSVVHWYQGSVVTVTLCSVTSCSDTRDASY